MYIIYIGIRKRIASSRKPSRPALIKLLKCNTCGIGKCL